MRCRSDQAWKAAFRDAGITLIKQQTQLGLPKGLYIVNMYAGHRFSPLRPFVSALTWILHLGMLYDKQRVKLALAKAEQQYSFISTFAKIGGHSKEPSE